MRFLTTLAIFALSMTSLLAQGTTRPSFLRYYEYADMMQAPDAAYKFGLYGFSNPAITSYLHDADFQISLSQNFDNETNKFGLFSGGPYSGFGLLYSNYGELVPNSSDVEVYDYRYSFAFGDRNFSLGLGYGFVGGDKSAAGRSNSWQWSFLYRPNGYFSLSGGQTRSIDFRDHESNVQVALRPIKTYPLALFADASLYLGDDEDFSDISDNDDILKNGLRYSYGISWEIFDGFRVNGRMFSSPFVNGTEIKGDYYSVGLDISLGNNGVALTTGNVNGQDGFATYSYRSGAKDRTIFNDFDFLPTKLYTTLDLKGGVKYQRSPFFDNSMTLLDVIKTLDEIKQNKLIKGVLINAVGFSANPSISWEIREKIKELRENGKKIYIFIERSDLEGYHFASVADKIIMEEMGSIVPTGYVLGGSYYKNMLDRLKIGYEELRLFKYKSAAERFAREGFSEGQEEQLQALVDSWYKTTVSEISEERPDLNESDIEKLINDQLFYFTDELKEKKFIDMVGRWTDREDVLEEIDDDARLIPSGLFLRPRPEPFDDQWSEDYSGIAVIYAVGVCAMEGGINARKLVEDVKRAVESKSIKAIVLRVDSPGGDALASEYIAKVIRENKGKKPIIVSQGMLAASGGYWLSMDGDKILASPKTITGSIGVISSWMYDKGAGEELGITTDIVTKGKYADLGYPWRDPLIGLGLPIRNLTDDERKQWEASISKMYDDFITKVAEGRDKDKDSIHAVAQGRVWTGVDGLDKGLVDELGGLEAAIKMARREAGYEDDELQNIYEYPKPKFEFSDLFTGLIGFNFSNTVDQINLVKFRAENNGIPMPLLPIDFWQYYVTE